MEAATKIVIGEQSQISLEVSDRSACLSQNSDGYPAHIWINSPEAMITLGRALIVAAARIGSVAEDEQ